ncbi:uncharacterized protein LOC133663136 [Entelurus aequoreus]|uniref:uncharacterized protein LOC133663136 n=1 Tax=Entelurus aequoreus TaxID=161455 RepID=UPI002B1D6B6A|nr:uncharacterized protein LOC133663136 [Entelurus aequoreus]
MLVLIRTQHCRLQNKNVNGCKMDIRNFFKKESGQRSTESERGEASTGKCILKDHAERDAEGEKDQEQSRQMEQGDPEMDPEAEEDQVITEREGEQTDQERNNYESAAATHSSIGFDLGDKDAGPRQVKLKSYPQDSFGMQKRAFHHSWFEKHNWLEYSLNQNTAFCFPCRVFGKNIKHDSLVSSGCTNWKKALVIFGKHEMAQTHKDSVVAWKSYYQATSKQGNVAQMIASANLSEIVERREYLRQIVAVTSMLGRQGLPFRGHDEGRDSTNRGNCLACMELLKEFDPFLQKHNPPSNALTNTPD